MATKELLRRLEFRRLQVPLPNLTSITVKYGKDVSKSPGHTTARKFVKNYLPAILYHNPHVQTRIERDDSAAEAPTVTALSNDGQQVVIDAKSVAETNPKSGDKAIFKQITNVDAELPDIKKKKKRKAPKKKEPGTEAEVKEEDEE